MTTPTYVLSIEPIQGRAFIWPFHLGTDIALAKKLAEEKFAARNASPLAHDTDGHVMATRTVALFLSNRIVDVYDGRWLSEVKLTDDDPEQLP